MPTVLRDTLDLEIGGALRELAGLGIETARLAPERHVKREGDGLARGRCQRMRLASLAEAAQRSGMRLVVEV